MTETNENVNVQKPDQKPDQNPLNEIKLFDTWNNKYFTVIPGSSLRTYICGPTVYSESHIGHLKTYLSFDIIRRILEDYFRVGITVVENITNVDDKIIKGAYQKFYGDQKIPDNYDLSNLDPSMYLDNQYFIDYADEWEKKFFNVMDSMKIRRPNIVARVTEYAQEMFDLVDAINTRGFAFEDDGSVYFYGTKYNNIKSDDGSFSKDPDNIYNFALLKKTKPFEPGWIYKTDNPNVFKNVTSVRFGWSAECAAIGSSVYGHNYDIHFGGVDLKIHHSCEMQQCNAIYKINELDPDWVNHFMHIGHLNIPGGYKMSRSLKNFITVPEIMKTYTHNQIRMLFLLHQWADTMDYSEDTMKHAVFYVNFFTNFFVQTKSILLRPITKRHKKFGPHEMIFFKYLEKVKLDVDSALRHNIDTPCVIKYLHELVNSLYQYVTLIESSETHLSEEIINDTVHYVRSMLNVFGLDDFDNTGNQDHNDGKVNQLLKIIQDIRTNIRSELIDCAKNIMTKVKPFDKDLAIELQQSIFKATDKIRAQLQLTDK